MSLRLKIIMNPSSGRETARINIEDMLAYIVSFGQLQRADIYYTQGRFDAKNYAKNTNADEYDYIIAAGGDGTVNEVVTGMLEGNVDLPLAIYTSGTVNDFATINNLPSSPSDFARMLMNPAKRKVDCGKVGDSFFLNVLAAGLMTDVAYKVPSDLKTAFGPAAYWMSAMKDIPSINNTISINIKANGKEYDANAIMFLLSNTASVGGFRKLMSKADLSDGLLDLLVLKKLEVQNVMPLLGRILVGEHINDDSVLYIQSDKFEITTTNKAPVVLDLDGEEGPSLPATIECIPGAITLLVPQDDI